MPLRRVVWCCTDAPPQGETSVETIQIQLDHALVQDLSHQNSPVPFYREMFFIFGIFQAVRQVVHFSWPDPQGRSVLAWIWLALTWALILQCMKAYHNRVRDRILLGHWIPAAMSTMALVLANNGDVSNFVAVSVSVMCASGILAGSWLVKKLLGREGSSEERGIIIAVCGFAGFIMGGAAGLSLYGAIVSSGLRFH